MLNKSHTTTTRAHMPTTLLYMDGWMHTHPSF